MATRRRAVDVATLDLDLAIECVLDVQAWLRKLVRAGLAAPMSVDVFGHNVVDATGERVFNEDEAWAYDLRVDEAFQACSVAGTRLETVALDIIFEES